MSTLSGDEIQRRALKGTAIDFLRSQEVAEAVAERFKAYLGKSMPPGFLRVGESARHPGTWRVSMDVTPHVSVSQVARQINVGETQRVIKAFRLVFRPEDLVTSWTRPPRKG